LRLTKVLEGRIGPDQLCRAPEERVQEVYVVAVVRGGT